MKFTIAGASLLLLSAFASVARADEYANAIKEWCDGLDVTAPGVNDVVVAGGQTRVNVTRVVNEKEKTITGLDLYSVSSEGQAKYVKNVWQGNFTLNEEATILDEIPANSPPGLYYYRVWITNMMSGGVHGPDCLETSHTFKVTSAIHTNSDGISYYEESLDDVQFYHPEYFKGCFGLSVDYPTKGQTFKIGDHIRVGVTRDTASQTDSLLKVDLYKAVGNNEAVYIDTVWEGEERFVDAFTLKDHLVLPEEHIDEGASYYYTLQVSSKKAKDATCTFHSEPFKIQT